MRGGCGAWDIHYRQFQPQRNTQRDRAHKNGGNPPYREAEQDQDTIPAARHGSVEDVTAGTLTVSYGKHVGFSHAAADEDTDAYTDPDDTDAHPNANPHPDANSDNKWLPRPGRNHPAERGDVMRRGVDDGHWRPASRPVPKMNGKGQCRK